MQELPPLDCQAADAPAAARSPRLLRGALPAELCAGWLAQLAEGPQVSRPLSRLAAPAPAAVLQAAADSAIGALVAQMLCALPLCNLDQSWIRHGRPPHGWHQDGALGFDFIANGDMPLRDEDLLTMCTCWIALTPCGHDAPGLEWVDAPQPRLLRPAELQPEAVAARHGPALLRRPVMQPGDALVFDGRLLHRTQLDVSMARQRTSIELRCFAAPVPARVAGDGYCLWPSR